MMANSDHKAGLRPSARRDGSQAALSRLQAFLESPPAEDPRDDIVPALKMLAYLRERFDKGEWMVVPANLQDGSSAEELTVEARVALGIAVVSIEKVTRRRMQSPTADA
nr:hypothetical protein [Dyella sp. ASV24]